MKRILFFLTLIGLLALPNVAKAELPGCPNTWNLPNLTVDISTSDYENYFLPSFTQIVKPGITEFSVDNVIWKKTAVFMSVYFPGNLTADRNTLLSQRIKSIATAGAGTPYGEDQLVISNLSLLTYPEIYVRNSISIEKKGCTPQTFTFSGKFPMPKIANVDFVQEFSQIEGFFRDFKAADTAKSKYYDCVNNWKSLGSKKDSIVPVERWCFLGSAFPIKGHADRSATVYLIPFSDNCLMYYPGNSNRSNGTQLMPGSNCQYAVVIGEDWKNFSNYQNDPEFAKKYLVTEVFTIKSAITSVKNPAPTKLIQITCSKGKARLVVSGKTPKCPTGYKKI